MISVIRRRIAAWLWVFVKHLNIFYVISWLRLPISPRCVGTGASGAYIFLKYIKYNPTSYLSACMPDKNSDSGIRIAKPGKISFSQIVF